MTFSINEVVTWKVGLISTCELKPSSIRGGLSVTGDCTNGGYVAQLPHRTENYDSWQSFGICF